MNGNDGDVEPPRQVNGVDLLRVGADRKRLWANGYPPVALLSHTDPDPKKAGKAPVHAKWVEGARKKPPEDARPDRVSTFAINTGIASAGFRFIDIDIGDNGRAEAIEAAAVECMGVTIIRHRSNSARRGMLYRAAEGQPRKRRLVGTTVSDGETEPDRVEILGNGQQFVAVGTHASGADIEWTISPLDLPADQLPAVTEEQISASLADCEAIIGGKATAPRSTRVAPVRRTGRGVLKGELARAHRTLMEFVPADDYDEVWIPVGAALHHEVGGSEDGLTAWNEWSAKSAKYDPDLIAAKWDSFEREATTGNPNVGFGTIYHIAAKYGWKPDRPEHHPEYHASQDAQADELASRDRAGHTAADWTHLWRSADGDHWVTPIGEPEPGSDGRQYVRVRYWGGRQTGGWQGLP
jgi:hypothetical protein